MIVIERERERDRERGRDRGRGRSRLPVGTPIPELRDHTLSQRQMLNC